jgi:hypothetical protein
VPAGPPMQGLTIINFELAIPQSEVYMFVPQMISFTILELACGNHLLLVANMNAGMSRLCGISTDLEN